MCSVPCRPSVRSDAVCSLISCPPPGTHLGLAGTIQSKLTECICFRESRTDCFYTRYVCLKSLSFTFCSNGQPGRLPSSKALGPWTQVECIREYSTHRSCTSGAYSGWQVRSVFPMFEDECTHSSQDIASQSSCSMVDRSLVDVMFFRAFRLWCIRFR